MSVALQHRCAARSIAGRRVLKPLQCQASAFPLHFTSKVTSHCDFSNGVPETSSTRQESEIHVAVKDNARQATAPKRSRRVALQNNNNCNLVATLFLSRHNNRAKYCDPINFRYDNLLGSAEAREGSNLSPTPGTGEAHQHRPNENSVWLHLKLSHAFDRMDEAHVVSSPTGG